MTDDRTALAIKAVREVADRKFGNPHSDWTDYNDLADALESGDLQIVSGKRIAALEKVTEAARRFDDEEPCMCSPTQISCVRCMKTERILTALANLDAAKKEA